MDNNKTWRQTLAISFALVGVYAALQAAEIKSGSGAKSNTTTTTPANTNRSQDVLPNDTAPRPTTGQGVDNNTNLNTGTGIQPGNSQSGTAVPEVNNDTTKGTVTQPAGAISSDVSGTIQSVERSGAQSRVRIRNAQGQVSEVTIDNNTSIMRNEKKTSVGQLRTGDEVTVQRKSATR